MLDVKPYSVATVIKWAGLYWWTGRHREMRQNRESRNRPARFRSNDFSYNSNSVGEEQSFLTSTGAIAHSLANK